MDKKVVLAIATVVVIAILGFWFFQNRQIAPPTSSFTSESTTIVDTDSPQATQSATPAQEITIEGTNFKFTPNQITVKNGTPVKITFKNTGGTHDFVIEGINVRTPITQSGQNAAVEFTPTQTGSFEYYCSIGTHRQMGMKGTLVVE